MSRANKISLIGGIILLAFMLIQIKYDREMQANFNEFQSKRYEIVKSQLGQSGLPDYQAHLIASAIRDESSTLASTIGSISFMHSYFTVITGLILISLIGYAVKKDKKE